MEKFVSYNPVRIEFGRGACERVGELARQYADHVLLHYGGGSIHASGTYARVTKALRAAGVDYTELGGVRPNPRLSLVREGNSHRW